MRNSLTVLFSFIVLTSFGQSNGELNASAILVKMGYGLHLPGGDLADRFGRSSTLDGGLDYILPSGKWVITGRYNYHFGRDVKEDPLDGIRNERGILIGDDGLPADLFLRQRMYYGQLGLLRTLELTPERSSSWTLEFGGGVGYVQHWIRLQDERNTARQINGAYEAGYDRMTRGWSVFEYVGIRYLQANKRVNFYAGFEFSQAFTNNIRPWDYDLKMVNDENRLDIFSGFKIGWILPFYLNPRTEEIYY